MNVNNLPAKCALVAALTFMTLSCLALDSRSQSKVSRAKDVCAIGTGDCTFSHFDSPLACRANADWI